MDTQLDPPLSVAKQRDSLMSILAGGSYPWMSPELLDFDACEHRPTKGSDIYALGMLIYEVRTRGFGCDDGKANKKNGKQVLCGCAPFRDLANSFMVVVEISKGARPEKPEDAARFGFTDGLWEIVERCWSADKDVRPTLEAVLSSLRDAASRWRVVG